jgi:threonine synthase
MGVPVRTLVIGSNRNDILPRFFDTGVMETHEVVATSSPAMDIQVSSNFERLLFALNGRDGPAVAHLMTRFRAEGSIDLGPELLGAARELISAARVDDEAVTRVIAATHARTGIVVDPHTAVGLGAASLLHADPTVPVGCLATAHPAKFPDAVEAALGERPALPPHLADLYERPERFETVPADLATVQAHVASAGRR